MPPIFHNLTDDELIRQYRDTDDARYVGELYRRYAALVLGVATKYLKQLAESEDAVMEIFEKLHHDLKRVEVAHFKSWLYTVTRNHCLMRLRKTGLSVEFPDEFPPPQYKELWDDEGDAALWKEQLLQNLDLGLNTLRPEQKICVEMFYLKDKSYKDIVLETGFSLNEVKTHIQNGKLNLKKMLTRKS